MSETLVEVRDLAVHYPLRAGLLRRRAGVVRAVDGISFDIRRGETLGVVGETGCGKSTMGRALLHLGPPITGGVRFDGVDLDTLGASELRALRPRMQMVFQDPLASLNPRITLGRAIAEPLAEHTDWPPERQRARVFELMAAVGLDPELAGRYPHEVSGGQRQRVAIARALALEPDFIVCDEPVAALDVSIQAQIVSLLEALQERFALTYLFISHDLGMVRHIADRVAVMYLGRIVELAARDALYAAPAHPYTAALLASAPDPAAWRAPGALEAPLEGDLPSPAAPPPGCNFCTRCPRVMEICHSADPPLREIAPGHFAACHLHDPEVAP